MTTEVEWLWLRQYEASHAHNPYVQEISRLRIQGAKQQSIGYYKQAANLYAECARIAQKTKLLELELVHSFLANDIFLYLKNSEQLLDLAIEIVVKAQKLNIDRFPWYPDFQFHLAEVYRYLDVLSYSNEILGIFDIVENFANHRLDLMCKLQIARSKVALNLQDFDTAKHYASLAIQVNPNDEYYHSWAYKIQADVQFRQGKFSTALESYKERELLAKKTNELPLGVIDALFSQGVCNLYLRSSELAEDCFAQSENLEDIYQLKVSEWMCYSKYIAKEDYETVVEAVSETLKKENLSPGTHITNVLAKAVVLNLMGRPNEQVLDLAREVAQNFKKPEAYNLWIDAVANGDTLFYNWHKVDHNKKS